MLVITWSTVIVIVIIIVVVIIVVVIVIIIIVIVAIVVVVIIIIIIIRFSWDSLIKVKETLCVKRVVNTSGITKSRPFCFLTQERS